MHVYVRVGAVGHTVSD